MGDLGETSFRQQWVSCAFHIIHANTCTHAYWPERHDLVRIGEVAPRVFHLGGVWVADLVIGAAIVGALDHDDICARAAQFNGVGLAGQLPAHHCHGDRGTAVGWTQRHTNININIKMMFDLMIFVSPTHWNTGTRNLFVGLSLKHVHWRPKLYKHRLCSTKTAFVPLSYGLIIHAIQKQ